MPQTNDGRHDRVLRLQRRIWRRLRREIRAHTGPTSADLARYERRFRDELDGPARPCAPADLLTAARSADIVFCGDFHTHPPSQAACLEVLQALAAGPSRVVLLLELALSRHQPHLDAWCRGEIDEVELLTRLDWHTTWGFPWSAYRPILEFARVNGIEMIAINGPGDGLGASLRQRDRWAAGLIARSVAARPRTRHLVLAGDLHMARSHLPGATSARLADLGLTLRSVRLLQNLDDLYWQFAADGVVPTAVRLADDTFCLFNGSPWEKLEGYLSWLEHDPEPIDLALAEAGDLDVTDLVLEHARALCRLLDLPIAAIDEDLVVQTPDDLRSIDAQDGGLARLAAANDVVLLPSGEGAFLARTDIAHLAEAAAEHILHNLSGPAPSGRGSDAFLGRIHRRALSFFASRLLVPTREPGPSHGCGRSVRTLIQGYVRHRGELLEGSPRLLEAAAEDDARSAWQLSLSLGRILGAELHIALVDGDVAFERFGELVRRSDGAGDPRAHLAELSALTPLANAPLAVG